jgi:proline iminopeptidase
MLRTLLRVLGALLLLVVALPAGLLAAVGAFFGAALLVSAVPLLTILGAIALLLVTGWLAWLSSGGLLPGRLVARRLLAGCVTGGWLLYVGLVAAATVFQPMSYTFVPKEPTADTRFWELPTGSRLAYLHIPAQGAPRPTPVVNLHGGPGAPGSFASQPEDIRLAAAGFDVYHYDQIGSGASARLGDVTEYTVARHVADLEAIRVLLGAERLILLGGSWGGTLAAHYLAAHPERVERVVFSSPGPIWAPAFANQETGSGGNASEIILELATLRFAVVAGLQQINPRAASNLAPDAEMSALFQQVLSRVIAADVAGCGPAGAVAPAKPAPFPSGFGYYANMLTTASLEREPDPRPALTGLPIPALILRGECDRMRPEVHEEFRALLPNATLVTLAGVGHAVNRSPQYAATVQAFVLGQPLPGAAADARP